MLTSLAANWGPLLGRAALAILIGILVLSWTGIPLPTLVFLFGAYALVDGILALFVAYRTNSLPGFGSLLFEGFVRIAAGVCVFAYPGISEISLLRAFTVWVIFSGIAEIILAIALSDEVSGEWPLPVAGTLSILFGVVLMLISDPAVLTLQMGLYALIFGMTLMALALRLRQLAHEIPVTVTSTSRPNSAHSATKSNSSHSTGMHS
jgi:uncharacterized membrane protein HdeD (DUF308 family)